MGRRVMGRRVMGRRVMGRRVMGRRVLRAARAQGRLSLRGRTRSLGSVGAVHAKQGFDAGLARDQRVVLVGGVEKRGVDRQLVGPCGECAGYSWMERVP
jgi:hypothetical protein